MLIAPAIAQSDRDELARYRAGRWFELRAIVTARSPALIRGAVAAALNDRAQAERLLRSVIRSQSSTEAADDAYALLCRTYLHRSHDDDTSPSMTGARLSGEGDETQLAR